MRIWFHFLYLIAGAALLTLAACGGSRTAGGTAKSNATDEGTLQLDGLMIDAKTRQATGKTAEAAALYRRIIAQQSRYAAAYYELGALMADNGQTDSALLMSRKAAELVPTNLWYQTQLAEIYEQRHDYRQMAECWETIVRQHPDVPDYYYELANAYVMAGEGARAVKTLDRVEERYGVSEVVSLQQKEIWEEMGRPDMAMKEVEQLAKALPHEAKYSAMMAEMYMKQRDYRNAKRYYDQILENHPEDEYIHFSLADYYRQTGDTTEALRQLEAGLRQRGIGCEEKVHVLTSFYRYEEMRGEPLREALRLTGVIAAQCEENAEVASFYGSLLMYDEQYGQAAEQFRRCLLTDSSRYEVWEMLLICLDASDAPTGEITGYARRAAALFPLHTLPHYLIGLHALMEKDYTAAQKALHRCEQMGFRRGYLEKQTYAMLGDCHYWLGEYDKAWRYFDKSLRLDSTDIGTLNNYAYFLSERGERLEQALRMSAKTIAAEPDNATYLDTYAWILHRLGRDQEALPYMERAVALSKEESETLRQHLEAIKKAAKGGE